MHWEEIPYSSMLTKIGEYDDEVFERIICVFDNRPFELTSEQKGDVRLILAAPDLLAACQAFIAAQETKEIMDIALKMAREAIEKAQYNYSLERTPDDGLEDMPLNPEDEG